MTPSTHLTALALLAGLAVASPAGAFSRSESPRLVKAKGAAGAQQAVALHRENNAGLRTQGQSGDPYQSFNQHRWHVYDHSNKQVGITAKGFTYSPTAGEAEIHPGFSLVDERGRGRDNKRTWYVSHAPDQKILMLEVENAKGTRKYVGEALQKYLVNPRSVRAPLIPKQPSIRALY
jgi:hypothetical protein